MGHFWYYPTVSLFVKASRSLIDMIFEPKIKIYQEMPYKISAKSNDWIDSYV